MGGAYCLLANLTNLIMPFCRYEDAVELLLKHGARVDVEARMCWPGPHQNNCEERVKHNSSSGAAAAAAARKGGNSGWGRSSDKLQCAIYYAIDGDQVGLPISRTCSYHPPGLS